MIEGTYRITRRIGEGGMGAVYEASHARLDGRYAVKFLHADVSSRYPAALARFRREARITSALRHPGIVQVIDFNTPKDGPPFLVMEYLDGDNLADVIAREAPFPLGRVGDITNQIASALAAAHAKGIVHRDLNPSNIFVVAPEGEQPERIKVLDFGVSKVRSTSKRLTGTAQVLGTPQYMAPEQAEGRVKELDGTADQFSLAAIVYEMLTGQPAFTGDTLATVAYQVVHAMPDPISDFRAGLPPAVEKVLARGLAKDKRDRFESVTAFAAAFRGAAGLHASGGASGAPWNDADTVVSAPGFVDDLAAHASARARATRPASDERQTLVARPRRRRPLAVIAGAGIVALALTLILVARARRQPPAPHAAAVATGSRGPSVQPFISRPPPAPPPPPSAAPPPAEATPDVSSANKTPATRPRVLAKSPSPDPGEDRPLETPHPQIERAPDTSAPPAPSRTDCTVTLGSSPWADVWIDGRNTGKHTPVVQLALPCGKHIVELRRQDLRLEHLTTVLLRAGDQLKARYNLEPVE